ncbi:MAG: histidinol dehydrogenase [Acidobacteria bacterium]|nr:histidinol dehydrogenase [Acidobacteriota bacterium]
MNSITRAFGFCEAAFPHYNAKHMEIINYKSRSRNAALERIQSRSLQMNPELVARVSEIVDGVRAGGDEALLHYTEKFDGVRLSLATIRVEADFIQQAAAQAEPQTVAAFQQAIANVKTFHAQQQEHDWHIHTAEGARLGQRILPVAAAGLYVPGGRAAYPSSIVMNAVPAQVAGVPRLVVATPPHTLEQNPNVAAVLAELGITEIYRIGGAQAIAALAFGTETIPRVDKIVGPGNIYVAIAKKLVYGAVGIDAIAGPSEVVVLADDFANPQFVAADLLAQAEHDEAASAICITTSTKLAQAVAHEVAAQLAQLERREIAVASIKNYGAIFIVESIEAGCELVNKLAPEHLELMTADNERTAALIDNAGAIFFGDWSSEPVGDYFAGPNHVLPTAGTARFSSPLGVYDFLKRQSIIHYTQAALEKNAAAITAMADAEGLTAHRQAIVQRLEDAARRKGEGEKGRGGEEATARQAKTTGYGLRATDYLMKVKDAVRAINAYTLAPYRASIKINQNENPFDMPEAIKQEVEARLANRAWSRYPDFVPTELLEKLAKHAGWKPAGTLAGNGSNELIQATLMVTVGQGARVLIPEPTFTLYRQIVTVMGGAVISVPLTAALQFDIDAIEQASHQADVMILCSPNNPTGSRVDEADLIYLAQNFDGIIVVDEAYQEFSGRTVVPLLNELPNLIVLRTFSKAMAMAGLRVGYFLSSPEITREVHKATLPYNLNVFSAMAAEVACEKYELIQPTVDKIISERERLFIELQKIDGLEVVPSHANFMLAKTPLKPKALFEKLLERDILVRDVSKYPMLAEYVRISVGSPTENDKLIAALKEVLGV